MRDRLTFYCYEIVFTVFMMVVAFGVYQKAITQTSEWWRVDLLLVERKTNTILKFIPLKEKTVVQINSKSRLHVNTTPGSNVPHFKDGRYIVINCPNNSYDFPVFSSPKSVIGSKNEFNCDGVDYSLDGAFSVNGIIQATREMAAKTEKTPASVPPSPFVIRPRHQL